jgi:hypothetical protein
MPITINLVCTRATDGNHIALQRWYADHVHLLLGAQQLQQAQLFRCTQPLFGQPPDYFCMYEFDNIAAFEAFEHGEPKAQASELTNAAAGRSSIEIVQRTQYERWLHRQWAAPTSAPPPAPSQTWRLAVCLQSDAAWSLDAQRALADQLQALCSCAPLAHAQAYAQHGDAAQLFLALDFAGDHADHVFALFNELLAQPSLFGQKRKLSMVWASKAQFIQAWLR